MYFDSTILWVIPGLLLGLWAQARVKSAYAKYSKYTTRSGVTAENAVAQLLRQNGAGDVAIQPTRGSLTDHYDPTSNTLRLSEGVYGSSSIAALGIAAHEAGHALQKAENYPFLSLRSVMVPVVNIGSNLAWPIFLAGILFFLKFIGHNLDTRHNTCCQNGYHYNQENICQNLAALPALPSCFSSLLHVQLLIIHAKILSICYAVHYSAVHLCCAMLICLRH